MPRETELTPEEEDSFYVHLDEMNKEHSGLSDNAFIDEVFQRYAQLPSQMAAKSGQSLAQEDVDTNNLLGKLGVEEQPMLTKDTAMQALTEVVGTWDSQVDDE